METIASEKRTKKIIIDLWVSFAIGTALSLILLAQQMISSDWTFPKGMCDFVKGTGGLLPLNPNEGGSTVYSCNPDLVMFAFYVLVPGVFFAFLVFILVRAIRWEPKSRYGGE